MEQDFPIRGKTTSITVLLGRALLCYSQWNHTAPAGKIAFSPKMKTPVISSHFCFHYPQFYFLILLRIVSHFCTLAVWCGSVYLRRLPDHHLCAFCAWMVRLSPICCCLLLFFLFQSTRGFCHLPCWRKWSLRRGCWYLHRTCMHISPVGFSKEEELFSKNRERPWVMSESLGIKEKIAEYL